MLRKTLIGISAAALLIGLALLFAGQSGGGPLSLWAGILLLALLVENWRYRGRKAPLDGEWLRTEERFVDPESGDTLRVYYDPRSGQRRYEKCEDPSDGPPSP
ncbi:MAG: hypothetical protein JO006_00570 [Paucibacter sp.]|nr:hypothetical protein [Roseateles sp.]